MLNIHTIYILQHVRIFISNVKIYMMYIMEFFHTRKWYNKAIFFPQTVRATYKRKEENEKEMERIGHIISIKKNLMLPDYLLISTTHFTLS